MSYHKESASLEAPLQHVRLNHKAKKRAAWPLALLAGLGLLAGSSPAKAQEKDFSVNEFSRLKREDPNRAAGILKQIEANPKQAKSILVQNRIEWCGAMEEFRSQQRLAGRSIAECSYGPPDLTANRNAAIPTSSTPFKTIRVKINIFANDDGSSPVATLSDANAQMEQLNKDYAPSRIRFVNAGVRFIPSTRFRNMASYEEISAMKTAHNFDPARHLNFYVFDAAAFNPNLLGVGYFPWSASPTGAQGGFFCDDNAFGAGQRTATHEIGHVLGLWHPHYGVSDMSAPAERCSTACAEFAGRSLADGDATGDLCSDTPATPRNFECGPPADNPETAANEAIDPCNNTPWGTTDYKNFMGYASDNCSDHFTPQQMGRMHGWINQSLRAWLVGADAGDPPTVTLPGATLMETVTTNKVTVSFSKPMDTASTQAAFRFAPALTGTYAWSNNNQTVTFTPSSLPSGTAYKVTILGTAPSAANAALTLDGNFNEVSNGSPADDYSFTFRSQGAPRNNMYAAAQIITGNSDSVPGFNIGANKETNEPNHGSGNGGASVWYKWTAPNTGNVTFDTSGANFDTSLGIYTGGSVGTLTRITSNEDESYSIYTSRVTFRAIGGTVYYIAVDGYNSSTDPAKAQTGSIVLRWNNIVSPANDFWANAQLISGTTGSATGTTLGAYDEPNEPYYSSATSGVWYKWVAPASGAVYFDTEGSNFDTNLAIYTGTSISTLTQVAYDYDSGTGSLSQAPFTAVANTTYYIAVSGGYGFDGARGSIKLNWRTIAAPANDPFATPIAISGYTGRVSGSNVGASSETNEPYGAGSPRASVWYKWIAPASGIMTMDTAGSGNNQAGTPFDTILNVYTGTTLSALQSVTNNDDAPGLVTSLAKWTAVKGVTYFISVDGSSWDWREGRGSFKLNWNLIGAPANDLFADAQPLGSQGGKLTGTNLGANNEPNEPYGAGSPRASVWFKWVAPANGMATFDTFGSGNNQAGTPFDTLINVYIGGALSNLQSVVNNDDVTGQITSRVRWTAQAGVTYYISVDGSAWNNDEAMGNYALNWSFIAAPANDLFANAQVLSGNAGRFNGTNIGANKEEGDPYGAGSPRASVWFKWVAPANGNVTFNTLGSGKDLAGNDFDTQLGAYYVDDWGYLSYAATNDDGPSGVTSSITYAATAGVTYYIAVDGVSYYYDETMGPYVLNWSLNGAISQAPTITSFTPNKGGPGTAVTINGSRFVAGATTVKFGGVTSASVSVSSTTQLVATVPAGAKTGPITVTTSGGTATSTSDFYVLPTITGFTPAQGMVGTTVTITGTNFTGATGVLFNVTAAREFSVVSPTQITAKVPPTALTGRIKVTTPAGTVQSATNFTVGPWIGSFAPAAAAVGSNVIIRGGNFTNVTAVKIGAITLTAGTYTVDSSGQLTAQVPANAVEGIISVTNAIGTTTSTTALKILPGITGFTPGIGKTGTVVIINGTNLAEATSVKFNGIESVFGVLSATAVRATVPTGAVSGKITIATPAGLSISANPFIIDNTAPIATIDAPITHRATLAAFPTTITGTVSDNVGITNVKILQLMLSRTFNGATQFWNPATASWSTTATKFDTAPVRPSTSTTWSFSGALPTGANLSDGTYIISIIPIDVPGNTRNYATTFYIKKPALVADLSSRHLQKSAHPEASSVILSTTEINASASVIGLKFSGPLKSADASHFTVTVNGSVVEIQSVDFSGDEVVLYLAEGTLHADDKVVVTWKNLPDTDSKVLNGFVAETVAP